MANSDTGGFKFKRKGLEFVIPEWMTPHFVELIKTNSKHFKMILEGSPVMEDGELVRKGRAVKLVIDKVEAVVASLELLFMDKHNLILNENYIKHIATYRNG